MSISLESYLNEKKSKVSIKREVNKQNFYGFFSTFLLPLLSLTGIIIATAYLSSNCTDIGITQTAALGTYLTLGITAAIACVVHHLILRGARLDKSWNSVEAEMKLAWLQELKKETTYSRAEIQTEESKLTIGLLHSQRVERRNQTFLCKVLPTLLLAAATILGVIFASQYIPQNTFSSSFSAGSSSLIGIAGVALSIALWIYINNRIYVSNRLRNDLECPSDVARASSNPQEFTKHYWVLALDDLQKQSVYSWLIPLIFVLIGTVFSCLCINEWVSKALQPYLFTAVCMGGLCLVGLHIIYTCCTSHRAYEFFQEAKRRSSPPPPPPALIAKPVVLTPPQET